MKFINYKIFRNSKDGKNKICFIEYNPEKDNDYFDFLKSNSKEHREQLIVNVQFMLAFIKFYIGKNYTLTDINFFDDALISVEEVNRNLKKLKEHTISIDSFIYKFEAIRNQENIEILKLIFDNDQNDSHIEVKANGIISIDQKNQKNIIDSTKEYMESIING